MEKGQVCLEQFAYGIFSEYRFELIYSRVFKACLSEKVK